MAADRQVRISDVGAIVHSTRYSDTTEYTSSQANVKVLRCHKGRVKGIVTEESPDMFLTVAEVCTASSCEGSDEAIQDAGWNSAPA